ncbi:MAG: hypothetical protein J6A96_04140 [Clostridia bacterium]|nr:hypothetical protein [Clostridia bacterium]
MFTRYKGINIPENYSGNRFKAPLETETKLHKPTPTYTGTKTSLSPTFEEVIRQKNNELSMPFVDEDEQDLDVTEDSITDIEDNEAESDEYNNVKEDFSINKPDNTYNENTTSRKATSGNGLLCELGSLIGKLTGSLKGEDLLILAIIVLLLSENNNDDNTIILPLLCLLLYS